MCTTVLETRRGHNKVSWERIIDQKGTMVGKVLAELTGSSMQAMQVAKQRRAHPSDGTLLVKRSCILVHYH